MYPERPASYRHRHRSRRREAIILGWQTRITAFFLAGYLLAFLNSVWVIYGISRARRQAGPPAEKRS